VWAGATGKALLSLLDEKELEIVFNFFELIPLTPNTITDLTLFKQEIIRTKELGYATNFSETEMGVAAIAAPIANYTVPASIAIIGPVDRIISRVKEFSEEIIIAATEISESLSKIL
jgi:DNA-binding IclR family transcriptional regulator